MPITVKFTLTAHTLYRAQLAVLRQITWMRRGGIFVVYIFPLLMLGFRLTDGRGLWAAIEGGLFWIVGFPVLWLFGIPLAQRWSAHRTVKATPALQGERVYTIDDEGIRVETGLSQGQTKWAAVVRAIETPEFFLLFLNKQMAYFLPKTAFDNHADVGAFRRVVSAALGSRAEWNPALVSPAT